MNSKKGELTLKFLIEIVLFAVVLILFVLPISVKLYNLMAGNAKPATISSMEMLIKEIKYLEGEEILPLFVDDKHILRGFNYDEASKPGVCKKEMSCICTCKLEIGCEGRGIERCMDVEYAYGSKKIIFESFQINPTERVTNFFITLAGDRVTVVERPGVAT